MIVVVDYGLGNTGSILNAFEKIGITAVKSAEGNVIRNASGIVFPGDGAAGQAMRNIEMRQLIEPIKDFIAKGKPFLGICLGMQILLTESEEGNTKCLGIVKGRVRKFNSFIKTPQIGWNKIKFQKEREKIKNLSKNINDLSYFYFINSYYCDPTDKTIIMATTDHFGEFCSIFVKGNILGVQFHPEKSANAGFQLLKNWTKLC
ncbi:imidazole glycerol phosphate synthase subunit HisH [Patescibacteria group bacterium]|nr:imidazole glycerol phosphate synthase subunit HisH [Patescibacteria group bacterium]